MKKPWWVRLCGWLVSVAIALLAFVVLNFKALPQTPGLVVLFLALSVAGFGLFVLWAGASIFLWA